MVLDLFMCMYVYIYICTCTCTWSMTSGAIQHGVPTNVVRGFFLEEAFPPILS